MSPEVPAGCSSTGADQRHRGAVPGEARDCPQVSFGLLQFMDRNIWFVSVAADGRQSL